jgi:hypothetical protein
MVASISNPNGALVADTTGKKYHQLVPRRESLDERLPRMTVRDAVQFAQPGAKHPDRAGSAPEH